MSDVDLHLRDPLPPLSKGLPAALLVLAGATLIVMGLTGASRSAVGLGLGPAVLILGLLRFVGRSVHIDGARRIMHLRIGPFGVGPESHMSLEKVREIVLGRLPAPGGGALSACPSIRLQLGEGDQLVIHVNPDAASCRAHGERLAAFLDRPLKDEL